jgi:RimJ/RimL family protein N-acetyltransferase
MLAGSRFPPDRAELGGWFDDHPREWRDGEAFRFAIEREGELVGIADIEAIRGESGSLGYWLSPRVWGLSIATEAARLLVDFGFGELGLAELRAGHAAGNHASGRVLQKLDFELVTTARLVSRSRGEEIDQCRYLLRRELS